MPLVSSYYHGKQLAKRKKKCIKMYPVRSCEGVSGGRRVEEGETSAGLGERTA